jgi:anti-sigma regulatory factor (Ser/Thr protein kinase)
VSDGIGISTPAGGAPDPADSPGVEDGVAVRLRLPAVPENVALVRQALGGFAEHLGIKAARIADMKIAITEACTNAVIHAYGEEGGPLDVTLGLDPGRVVLTVRDHGHGLRPLPSISEGPPFGFGLALIASLSDEFGIAGGQHGTEVRIGFAVGNGTSPSPLTVQVAADEPWPPNETVLLLSPGDHAAPVLGRVVALVAARADFSIDRLSDAQIVSDAIAGAAGRHTLDGTTQIAIDEHDEGFDLVVGPLAPGGGTRLIEDSELPGLGRLLERLTDALEVEAASAPAEGERLRATLRGSA